MAKKWVEIPVFLHGITPEDLPNSVSIQKNYEILLTAVQERFHQKRESGFTGPAIEVMWGFASGQSGEHDNLLANAELVVLQRTRTIESETSDFTLNPMRLLYGEIRRLFLTGFADLLYYVSMDGEGSVREHVFNYIGEKIKDYIAPSVQSYGVSLTFFAHSAGTIITHDFLYHLFRAKGSRQETAGIKYLRGLVSKGRLRVRRFYSMGSPITPAVFRASSLLQKVTNGELLNLDEMGFRETDGLSNPRWVNFWDVDDVASFPVEFLYHNISKDGKKIVEDKYVDVGDGLPNYVHLEYWANQALADYIVQTW